MDGIQETLLYFVAAGIIGIGFKIIWDWLIMPKNNPGNKREIDKQLTRIETICANCAKIHEKTDTDGIPLVYIPRNWKASLDAIADETSKSANFTKQLLTEFKEYKTINQLYIETMTKLTTKNSK